VVPHDHVPGVEAYVANFVLFQERTTFDVNKGDRWQERRVDRASAIGNDQGPTVLDQMTVMGRHAIGGKGPHDPEGIRIADRDRALVAPEVSLNEKEHVTFTRVGAVAVEGVTGHRLERSKDSARRQIEHAASRPALFQHRDLLRLPGMDRQPVTEEGQGDARGQGSRGVQIEQVQAEALLLRRLDNRAGVAQENAEPVTACLAHSAAAKEQTLHSLDAIGRSPLTIHLLHLRKTGGTVLKHVLEAYAHTSECTIIPHGHSTVLRDVPLGEKVIFFLRDPLTRFVSGFYCRQRQGSPRYNSPWKPAERAAFERFQSPNDLARTLSSPDPTERELAWSAMGTIQHLCSTLTWLESEAYLRSRLPDILYIGFQEALSRDFECLKKKLNLPAGLRLTEDEVEAHRHPPHLDYQLDALAVANLREWYEADQHILDLCRLHAPQVNRCQVISPR